MESPLWTDTHTPALEDMPQEDVREYLQRAIRDWVGIGRSNRGNTRNDLPSDRDDKPPVFILNHRGNGQRFVPSKAADESAIRLMVADCQQESLTVYTDGFRAYELLDVDGTFDREYVVHSDGKYADGGVHINTCWSPSRCF